jgi:hypothetical protein
MIIAEVVFVSDQSSLIVSVGVCSLIHCHNWFLKGF